MAPAIGSQLTPARHSVEINMALDELDHMWSATADGGLVAYADYLHQTKQFEVVVTLNGKELRETIPSQFEPRFGPDVADIAVISEVAEKLAQQLENDQEGT